MMRWRGGGALAIVMLAVACDVTTFLPELPTAAPLFVPEVTPPWATLDLGGSLFQGPVAIGQPLTIGQVEVKVNRFVRPANDMVLRADGHPELEPDEEFALVDVSITCRADSGETCNVSEFNFSLRGDSTKTYYAELTMFLSGLRDLLEASDTPAGETRSGYLLFILARDEAGLELSYTAMPGGFGPQGTFTLEP